MQDVVLTIIGAGPRALNVIERLATRLLADASLPRILIHLVDPGDPCAGAHEASQSRHLLTNTLASQVTMFSPLDLDDPSSEPTGPSFTEWANMAGYRRFGTEYRREEGGSEIGNLDYLPRAMLGEYLSYAYRCIVARVPDRLQIVHHRDWAVDASERPCFVETKGGMRLFCHAIIMTTGHCELKPGLDDLLRHTCVESGRTSNPMLDYFQSVYPTASLNRITPGAVVAVQGLGLTMHDVIAELTAGRGGRFEEGDALRYVPSGREAKILLFSRQSLPSNARAVNQKGVDGGHQPRFLTVAAVEAARVRLQSEGECLDFARDIIPLIRKDMAWAYRASKEGLSPEVEGFELSADEKNVLDDIVAPQHLLKCSSMAEFRSRVLCHLRDDLLEARKGNSDSARKAATDSIRDLRPGLAAAIEYAGLSSESHRFVNEHFVPLTNRITFGPPLRRNAELIALIEAGVVDWGGGPGARISFDQTSSQWTVRTPYPTGEHVTRADVLAIARVPVHRPLDDAKPLSARMAARGAIRPFRNSEYHPFGIDVDRHMRVVRSDGSASSCIWALGYLTEGARFHTHALPRPRRRSTQLIDAAILVDDLLGAMPSLKDDTVVEFGSRIQRQSR